MLCSLHSWHSVPRGCQAVIPPGGVCTAARSLTLHARGTHLESGQMNTFRATTPQNRRDVGDFAEIGSRAHPTSPSIPRQSSGTDACLSPPPSHPAQSNHNDDPSGHVTVVDDDPEHASSLGYTLTSSGFRVTVCDTPEALLESIVLDHAEFVLIVFRSAHLWRQVLESLCESVHHLGFLPTIVCVLRWVPKSPSERLFGDRLKVVVLHEW